MSQQPRPQTGPQIPVPGTAAAAAQQPQQGVAPGTAPPNAYPYILPGMPQPPNMQHSTGNTLPPMPVQQPQQPTTAPDLFGGAQEAVWVPELGQYLLAPGTGVLNSQDFVPPQHQMGPDPMAGRPPTQQVVYHHAPPTVQHMDYQPSPGFEQGQYDHLVSRYQKLQRAGKGDSQEAQELNAMLTNAAKLENSRKPPPTVTITKKAGKTFSEHNPNFNPETVRASQEHQYLRTFDEAMSNDLRKPMLHFSAFAA